MTATITRQRLAYIDWLRGLACLGMFEVHCYDSWLGGASRHGPFFRWSQLVGSIPGALFIFISGVSCVLVADRLRRKGASENRIAMRTIRRGAEVFGLGLLFRVQEFALGQPGAPWTDLLRVDVLNLIGLTIVLMGVVMWIARSRMATTIASAGIAGAVAMFTPLIWTTWQPRWLPWYLESYINGVHIYGTPQPWLFPIFPWAAFGFVGLATGLLILSERAMSNPARTLGICGSVGAALFLVAYWLDARPIKLYSVYDYWHTSPNFFLARVGVLLLVVFAGYAWCRWGLGTIGFSPLAQIGQTSLLVYWVHIEFVYGRFSILPKRAQTIPMATLGLAIIFAAMVLLSIARTRTKGRGREILATVRAWLGFGERAKASSAERPVGGLERRRRPASTAL
jgi:uncharacterized membrane protein